jgi:hypothetical protein
MRTVDAARLGLGLALLVRPDLPQDALATRTWGQGSGLITDSVTRRVIQALGARYVVQGLAGAVLRWHWVPAADATVDLVHAASMLAVAHLVPEHRRLATTSAAAALLFVVADLRATTHVRPRVHVVGTPPRPRDLARWAAATNYQQPT